MKRTKKRYDYEQTIKLNHNEVAAKINVETGEVTQVNTNRLNINLIKFEPNALFKKKYNNSWQFLMREFTPLEVSATSYLVQLSQMNTGSLEPLNDSSTVRELSQLLNVSVNKVTNVLKKLFLYGVYGKFEVFNPDKPFTKFWIINPYLIFAGSDIDPEIIGLFKGTYIAKAFNNPNFVFQKTKRNVHLLSQKCDKTSG